MPGALLWGWDDTNKKWIPLAVDANGYVKVDMSNINLDDLADVDVSGVADDDFFYYDSASGLWKPRKVNFLDLSDTPSSYAGQAKKPVRVNAAEDAVEFGTAGYVFKPLAARAKVWRFPALGDTSRTATVSSVADDVITLTTNVADQFFTDNMEGFCYLLIRNTTKSENAWVKAYVDANEIQVTDSADISGWQNGDSIRGHSEIHPTPTKYTDIDVTPAVGATAKQVFLYIYLKDTAAGSMLIPWASSMNVTVVTQVANTYNSLSGVLTLDTGQTLAVRTVAADSAMECVIDIIAYTE